MDSKVVRADFDSGLPTLANQILARTFFRSVANSLASPAVGKFSRASSAGGRRHLRSNFVNRIVSVAEDCLSPERTFHGCTLMHGLKSDSCRFWQRTAHVGESNSRSNVFQIPSRFRLRIQPLESSLGRVPQAADETYGQTS